jgi:hypothetical protein
MEVKLGNFGGYLMPCMFLFSFTHDGGRRTINPYDAFCWAHDG